MPTFGVDISGYQPRPEVMDGFSFAILNVEDPGLLDKVEHAEATGVRWAIYTWVYPNDGGHAVTRGNAALELLAVEGHHSDFPVLCWFDYEEAGVGSGDLAQNLQLAVARGIPSGTYTYLNVLPSVRGVIDHFQSPLWLAYYPGHNDGTYHPEFSDAARAEKAVIHQYSSTNGTLDRNVVIDEEWYAAGSKPAPSPVPRKKDPMALVVTVEEVPYRAFLVDDVLQKELRGEATGPYAIPAEAQAAIDAGALPAQMSRFEFDTLLLRTAKAAGGDIIPGADLKQKPKQ